MKKLIIILLALISLHSQLSLSQTPLEKLTTAYKENSKEKLKEFFETWSEDIPPISIEVLNSLNDTLRETYSVFKEFYRPLEIEKLGKSEFGFDTYKNAKYFLVQNEIKIYFCEKLFYNEAEVDSFIVKYFKENLPNDTLKRIDGKIPARIIEFFGPNKRNTYPVKYVLTDSITYFRPQIRYSEAKPLYLNYTYTKTLNDFLENNYKPLGTGNIMNPAYADGESQKRMQFLLNYVKIFYGHWGGYWQLETYPETGSIIFDKNMEYAKIYFRMIYEGGETMLKKENGEWKIISSELTWIE